MRIYTKAQGGWAQREFSKESDDLVKKSNDNNYNDNKNDDS